VAVLVGSDVAPARARCEPATDDVDACTGRCATLAPAVGRACRRACRPARIRTLAWVVTECRQRDPSALSGRIRLLVRRGDCAPITVATGPEAGGLPDVFGDSCRRFLGETRFGPNEVVGGIFERLGVSPDGRAVVYEVTDDFSSAARGLLAPEDKGIFFVRSDGRGRQRLGPPSRDPSWRIRLDPRFPIGIVARFDEHIPFSPNGRLIALTDLGPGPNGEDASQVVTIEVATHRRHVVTHLPNSEESDLRRATGYISFVDDETLLFFTSTNPDGSNPSGELRPFTIHADGTGLRAVPSPTVLPGSRVVPIFSVTRPQANLLDLQLPLLGPAINPYRGYPSPVTELFTLNGRNLVQLTQYGRWDTGGEFLAREGRHVFFHSSADTLGTNPTNNCQLFSIDTLGGHLRQVTQFSQGGPSANGCFFGPSPGCDVRSASQDPVTGTIVFYSSCDPFGANPFGAQLFAMRADGRGLRQLTRTLGMVPQPDGGVMVEIPGPFAYSARAFGTFPK
jgi:hypothetical protein